MARRTPKSARKQTTRPKATQPVVVAHLPRSQRNTQPVRPLEAPPPMSAPRQATRARRPNVEQPLDPPEFAGSVLSDIRARWIAGGSLLPQPAESEKLLTSYRKAHALVEETRAALQAHLATESAAILDLARAFGSNSLRIDGTVHDFACRGDTVFFRRKSVSVIDTDERTKTNGH